MRYDPSFEEARESLDLAASPARPARTREPVRLAWTDAESAERLVVEVWGAGDFLSELLELGFVVRDGSRGEIRGPCAKTGAERDDGTGAGDRMGETCTGASFTARPHERGGVGIAPPGEPEGGGLALRARRCG